MVFALVFARGAVNSVDNPTRQSFVIEMVGCRPGRQRGRPQQRPHPLRADRRPRGRRDPDRDRRRRSMLPHQRGELRGDDRRPACDGPGAARAGAAARAGRRRRPRGARLRRSEPGARDPAGDDGRRRHAGVQLPGAAAAARAVHLRRRRRPPTRRSRSRWRSDRSPARCSWAPGAASASARSSPPRPGSVSRRCSSRPPRRSRSRCVAFAPLGVRQRHLRRLGQLDPSARGDATDARPGDGALLGRVPRLDADRRATRRLARRDRGPTRRPRPRRRRGALGCAGRRGRLCRAAATSRRYPFAGSETCGGGGLALGARSR